MDLYLNLAMAICALIGMSLGGFYYLAPRRPLYASMIVLGVGCIVLGRTYQFARLVTGLDIIDIFQLGVFGIIGTFSFFFSANFGQIDSLVDDGSKEFVRYRVIAWIGPIIVLVLYVIGTWNSYLSEKISFGMVAASIAAASYYHIKHIFIPDVDYGVVHCLRKYNTAALLYGLLCMLEIIFMEYRIEGAALVTGILQCIISIIIVPLMDKGVKLWSI